MNQPDHLDAAARAYDLLGQALNRAATSKHTTEHPCGGEENETTPNPRPLGVPPGVSEHYFAEPTAYPCVTIGSEGDVRTGPIFEEFKGCDCRLIPWRDWKAAHSAARGYPEALRLLEEITVEVDRPVGDPWDVTLLARARSFLSTAKAQAENGGHR